MRPHIVLIEDDPVQHMVLERMLQSKFVVTGFYDPEAALAFLINPSKPIDIVLCDILMPVLNGLELKIALNQACSQQTPPAFVFLTADQTAITRQAALKTGVDDILYKPVTPDNLYAVIERALNRVQQWQRDWQRNIAAQIDSSNPLAPAMPQTLGGGHPVAWVQHEVSLGGGDFLCHIPHHTGDIIIMADVMGHGMPAKFFAHAYMGYLYGLVRAMLDNNTQTLSPSFLLNQLNVVYTQDIFLQRWQLTLQILHITNHGEFLWAGAAHPSPYVWMSGAYHALPKAGPMIGLAADTIYKDYRGLLAPDQALVLYTDGALPHGLETTQKCNAPTLKNLANFRDINDDATLCILQKF
jgi:phosphoserine phosphatase RsbU/P